MDGGGGAFGKLLVELGYPGHANGIFCGAEALLDRQTFVQHRNMFGSKELQTWRSWGPREARSGDCHGVEHTSGLAT